MRVRLLFVALVATLLIGGGLVGCSDDNTPPPDGTLEAGKDIPQVDTTVDSNNPDQAPPDTFVWPDQSQDQIIWPDTYAGTPFGCKTDADCFGQKCCPTPWGVKLCASSCPKK